MATVINRILNYASRAILPACLVTLTACEPSLDIDLPPPDSLNATYPIGIMRTYNNAHTLVISRYQTGKPVLLYLPDSEGPYPVVVFNHGRPFTMPSNYAYYPDDGLVSATLEQGYALAVVIRGGYFLAGGADQEIIPCNRPEFSDIQRAGNAATQDITDAIRYLLYLDIIDESRIIIAGSSAGGFASISALPAVQELVIAAITFNGGRCGSRGNAIGGLAFQQEVYARVAGSTSTPVYFLAGGNDDVIPVYSTRTLFMAFCRAREDCVQRDRTQLFVDSVGTHDVRTMLSPYRRALSDINSVIDLSN